MGKAVLTQKDAQTVSASSEMPISAQPESEEEDPDDPGPTRLMHRAQTSTNRGMSVHARTGLGAFHRSGPWHYPQGLQEEVRAGLLAGRERHALNSLRTQPRNKRKHWPVVCSPR